MTSFFKIMYNVIVNQFYKIINLINKKLGGKFKMVKLRLTRLGRKRVPFYRIAAMEALSRRDGESSSLSWNIQSIGRRW